MARVYNPPLEALALPVALPASPTGTSSLPVWAALRRAAWANVVLHAAGLVLAGAALREGTPATPLLARMSYLAGRPWGWTAGWLTWIACALAVAAFMVLLARARPSPLLRAAAGVALVAAVVDIACNVAYLAVLPGRAAGAVSAFVAFERGLTVASQAGANGLYSVAVAAATRGLWASAGRALRWLGVATVAGGAGLAVAGLIGHPGLVAVSTGLTITAFAAWTLAASRPPR